MRDDASELGAQRIEHFLRVLRRTVELGFDRLDDFRMTQSVAVESEAAEHVDEFASERIADDRSLALPFGESKFPAKRGRLAMLEEPGVDVVGKVVDRLLGNALPGFHRDRGGRLFDKVEHPSRLGQRVFVVAKVRRFQRCGGCGCRFGVSHDAINRQPFLHGGKGDLLPSSDENPTIGGIE